MERWAANTLRGLGILITAILMIAAALLLLLMSLCTWKSTNNGQSIGYLIGALFVLALGIFVIAKLTRGLMTNANTVSQSTLAQPSQPALPVHISPASATTLNQLSYAIGANIALGVLLWGMTLYRLLAIPAPTGAFERLHQPWLVVTLIGAAIHYVPYLLLLFRLQRNPDRPALAFAMGIPAASLLQTLTSLPLLLRIMPHPQAWSQGVLPTVAVVVALIAILYLAWRANQRLGYRQEPVSLIVAAAAAYVYFMIFGSSNTWMYRLIH